MRVFSRNKNYYLLSVRVSDIESKEVRKERRKEVTETLMIYKDGRREGILVVVLTYITSFLIRAFNSSRRDCSLRFSKVVKLSVSPYKDKIEEKNYDRTSKQATRMVIHV